MCASFHDAQQALPDFVSAPAHPMLLASLEPQEYDRRQYPSPIAQGTRGVVAQRRPAEPVLVKQRQAGVRFAPALSGEGAQSARLILLRLGLQRYCAAATLAKKVHGRVKAVVSPAGNGRQDQRSSLAFRPLAGGGSLP